MKKLLAIALTVLMCIAMLVGCAQTPAAPAVDAETAPEVAAAPEEAAGPDHIVVAYMTSGQALPDIDEVLAAVNAITVEKINVEIELKEIAIAETFSGVYSLWISSGEVVDLICIAFQNIADYVQSGQLEELDSLIAENAPTLSQLMAEFPLTDAGTIDGKVYGVTPVMANYGFTGGLVMRADYFKEIGETEVKEQYTWEEIGDILGRLKAAHPDSYPLSLKGSSVGGRAGSSLNFMLNYDQLGAASTSGVLLGFDDRKIVNLYETEEYLNYIKMMREWAVAGYIEPDAATTDTTAQEDLTAGKSCCFMMNLQPIQFSTQSQYGWDSVGLRVTKGMTNSSSPSRSTNWAVPITSQNPVAAIRFLDLLYEDHDLATLIFYGIEGKHWVKTDNPEVIAFPEGVDADTSGYYNSLGVWGDRRFEYVWTADATRAANDAFTQHNLENQYLSRGYSYNSEKMSNELVAVTAVLNQYLPALETGSVEDVEGTYQEFIQSLKLAGIDEIIADNQAQFDAWLAVMGR